MNPDVISQLPEKCRVYPFLTDYILTVIKLEDSLQYLVDTWQANVAKGKYTDEQIAQMYSDVHDEWNSACEVLRTQAVRTLFCPGVQIVMEDHPKRESSIDFRCRSAD